ncbi:uncharacterized protein MELLADRAFT_71815 [Melampsora larici-populina 98AG31]|uniref:Ubiquinone biosynthesis O-methyltransferase, mitochondrial n=1 Tax=Melampsora larici-populina (strain 98AG31 / pathotype 3-4-7) TaxID=747676 RepID=F4RLF2_MELLP|nr:uncharacterized protein MELLADRAFT_71815 [Melampsora larici-populina 98AG31]EGG07007.1 hypothetical protein MELLADRAFT_71815 [Melampsora larici-populina 98AG31]
MWPTLRSIIFRPTSVASNPIRSTARQLHSTTNPLLNQESSQSNTSSSFNNTTASNATVSPEEIKHFNSLASTWWDESGGFGLLHRMNPIRTQFIRERILYDVTPQSSLKLESPLNPNRFLSGQKVLDVGCGGGIFSEVLSRLGGDVLGIDAAAASIKVASSHASNDSKLNFQHEAQLEDLPNQENRLRYRHCSVEDLLKEDDQQELYDVVCAMEVIEHVEDPHAFLTGLAKLTKPGGHLILSTISRTPLARLLTIYLAESNLPFIGLVPPGTHTYEKFVKPEELTDFFRNRLGWAKSFERSELETRGSFYEPLTGHWNLFPREFVLGELVNYFFGVKKPLN